MKNSFTLKIPHRNSRRKIKLLWVTPFIFDLFLKNLVGHSNNILPE